MLLLHPTFFAPIIQYVALLSADEVTFEHEDNFQKQTYRNRCYIAGPNGKQLLSVPVQHSQGKGRQKTKDVKLDNSFRWQKNMLRSLEASYRSSPFFEFYEDDIRPVFEKRFESLIDLNLATIEVVNSCLELQFSFDFTDSYREHAEMNDLRRLVDAKSDVHYDFMPYNQVFESRNGFLSNLSILDLLFNEGPNAPDYLQKHAPLLEL